MENSLIDIVKTKMKLERMNAKQLAEHLSIKPDNLYKWLNNKAKPKTEDAGILKEWVNGTFSNKLENSTGIAKNKPDMGSSHTEELINSLKKNVEILEKRSNEQENIIKELIKANGELKTEVQENLKTVLDNQLTLTVLFESYLKSFSSLMIEEPEQQQEFRLLLHKSAFVQLKAIRQTGSKLVIDKEDIVSEEAC